VRELVARPVPSLVESLFGGVDRHVLPVVPITFLYNVAFSTFWVYVGVFAVEGLGWRTGEIGLLFLATAPPAAVANYLSGRISDRVGRKRPIVASFLAAAAIVVALALDPGRAAVFGLIVALGVAGAPAYSLDRVLVADLVAEADARERGYAAVRVAGNLGAFAGPPLAALLIALGGWNAFLAAVAGVGVVGAAVTIAVLPDQMPTARRETRSGVRVVLRDRPFLLLLLSSLLAFAVYCGFEAVLPVIAVSSYGLAPATWGLLVVISPVLVVLFQLRLTRSAARISVGRRLPASILLMGLPFLVLLVDTGIPAIAAVIVVFVLGEMLWSPTSQTITAELAPEPARGAYFGALAAMTGPAWTLAPFAALELRAHSGVPAVWVMFAAIAVAGALAGVAAIRSSEAGSATRYEPVQRRKTTAVL
jgi:predicted MFS family arabinose efflux permease